MSTRREFRRFTKEKGVKERAKAKGYASVAGRLDICGEIALKKKDSRKVLERQVRLVVERGRAGSQEVARLPSRRATGVEQPTTWLHIARRPDRCRPSSPRS